MTAPLQHSLRVNGIELCYFEWRPDLRGNGPTLLMTHATGFHARCWDQVISHLADRHVIAVDQRGHGRSEETPIHHWKQFGSDLAELILALDLENILGVGHSMGGHATVDAAAGMSNRFRRLVLIDPTIASPQAYDNPPPVMELLQGEMHPAARRKNHFTGPDEMFERFRDRHPYSLFDRAALRDYCEYGLLRQAHGDYRLACPPQLEASIYMTSRTNGAIYDAVSQLTLPVLIVRAKLPTTGNKVMDFASSPTWPELVGEFESGREIHLADHSHFLPMEIPQAVGALIDAEHR